MSKWTWREYLMVFSIAFLFGFSMIMMTSIGILVVEHWSIFTDYGFSDVFIFLAGMSPLGICGAILGLYISNIRKRSG